MRTDVEAAVGGGGWSHREFASKDGTHLFFNETIKLISIDEPCQTEFDQEETETPARPVCRG